MNFDEINNITGFGEGDLFENKQEILQYFTIDNMVSMFGECHNNQEELSNMANTVIENNWMIKMEDD